MKKTNIIALGALIATTSAVAGTEVDALKDRVTELENAKSKIEFSGLIEVGYVEDRLEGETLVETVELGITANLTDNLNANLVLLSEADDNGDLPTDNLVDEATLNGNINGIGFTVGKLTAPFGAYETAMNSDPAGLDIGETGGVKALVLSTEVGGVTLSAWAGNSKINNNQSKKNNGFSIGYEAENFAVGVDAIRDAVPIENGVDTQNNKGVAIHGQVSFNNITVIAEQITVENNGAADSKEKQLELQYATGDWTLAARRDGGDTKSNAYGVSYVIAEGANLTVENYKPKDGNNTTSVKLAYEF